MRHHNNNVTMNAWGTTHPCLGLFVPHASFHGVPPRVAPSMVPTDGNHLCNDFVSSDQLAVGEPSC